MGRTTTRQTQSERRAETRAALVEAAATLFAEQGFDAVSVDAVADAAGRTSGAVYDHFGSKQGLLRAVLDDGAHRLVTVISAEMELASSLLDRLRAVADNVIVHPSEGTRRLLMLEHELILQASRDSTLAEALRCRARQALKHLARGLSKWMADGVLPAGSQSPEMLASTIRALVLGMELQQRLDPSAFDVERAARVLQSALCPMVHTASTAAHQDED